ncbi:MAG: hypothetical protein OXE92_06100, partial [Bacteroidetes bacterium]|nr:hypothetical protein [Bacteroidota bacterium]
RIVERTTGFDGELKKLSKKHRGLTDKVEELLEGLSTDRISDGDQLNGCSGYPVFKKRCGTGNVGRRGGARIIYYKDEARLGALSIYLKSRKTDISSKQVMALLMHYLLSQSAD